MNKNNVNLPLPFFGGNYSIDRVQLNMYTFSTRSLILGHHGTVTLIYQHIFHLFKNYIAQYTIYSFNCVLG